MLKCFSYRTTVERRNQIQAHLRRIAQAKADIVALHKDITEFDNLRMDLVTIAAALRAREEETGGWPLPQEDHMGTCSATYN